MSDMKMQPKIIASDSNGLKVKGFNNKNNNCYVNCVLQMLFHIPEVTSLLLNSQFTVTKGIFGVLNRLYLYYQHSDKTILDPTDFCQKLSELSGLQFQFGEQQDVSELLLYLLYKFQSYRTLHPPSDTSLFQYRTSTSQCVNCDSSVPPLVDEGLIFLLHLPTCDEEDSVSLETLLESYFNSNGDQSSICSTCGQDKGKGMIIDKISNYFIIQLVRYDNNLRKLSMKIEVPLYLNLGNYTRSICNAERYNYRLHSQIYHTGDSLHEGHYTVDFISKDQYFSIDDWKFCPFDLKDHYVSQNNYIICYESSFLENETLVLENESLGDSSIFLEQSSENLHNDETQLPKEIPQPVFQNRDKSEKKQTERLPLQQFDGLTGELLSWRVFLVGYERQSRKFSETSAQILEHGGILSELQENPFDNRYSMVICPSSYQNYIFDECYYANYLRRCIVTGSVKRPKSTEKCQLRLAGDDPRNYVGVLRLHHLPSSILYQDRKDRREEAHKNSERLPLQQFHWKTGKLVSFHIALVGFERHGPEKNELCSLIIVNGGVLSQLQENPWNLRYGAVICPEDYHNNIIDECYYDNFLRRCIDSGRIVQPRSDERCPLHLAKYDLRNFDGILHIKQQIRSIAHQQPILPTNEIPHSVGSRLEESKKRLSIHRQSSSDAKGRLIQDQSVEDQQKAHGIDCSSGKISGLKVDSKIQAQSAKDQQETDAIDFSSNMKEDSKVESNAHCTSLFNGDQDQRTNKLNDSYKRIYQVEAAKNKRLKSGIFCRVITEVGEKSSGSNEKLPKRRKVARESKITKESSGSDYPLDETSDFVVEPKIEHQSVLNQQKTNGIDCSSDMKKNSKVQSNAHCTSSFNGDQDQQMNKPKDSYERDITIVEEESSSSKKKLLKPQKVARKIKVVEELTVFVRWLIASDNLRHIQNDRKYPALLEKFSASTNCHIESFRNARSVCQHIRRILANKIFEDPCPYSFDDKELALLRAYYSKKSN